MCQQILFLLDICIALQGESGEDAWNERSQEMEKGGKGSANTSKQRVLMKGNLRTARGEREPFPFPSNRDGDLSPRYLHKKRFRTAAAINGVKCFPVERSRLRS